MNNLPANTLLDDPRPARFLKVTDLLDRWKVQQLTLTISRLAREETIPNPADIDPVTRKPRVIVQLVLYFKSKDGNEFPRAYLLSAQVDIQSMKESSKAGTVGELTGNKITIIVSQHRGKAVLRISPTKPQDLQS